jgi:hypothetical protein
MEAVIRGLLLFAIAGVVLVGAYVTVMNRRRAYEDTGDPRDRLSDEEFRRVEFGDDEP